jgi:tRNA modification GTPase
MAPMVQVSATKRVGIELLQDTIRNEGVQASGLRGDSLILVSVRHRTSIEKARDAVGRALRAAEKGIAIEFLALEIKGAVDHLGEVIGITTPEDLLDQVFSRFCIGK